MGLSQAEREQMEYANLKDVMAYAEKTPDAQRFREGMSDIGSKYNLIRDTMANPFSSRTSEYIAGNENMPEQMKEFYDNTRDKVMDATGGLAGSDVLTKGLRYSNAINKGIDMGIALDDKVTDIKQDIKEDVSRVNEKIDDKVESMRQDEPVPHGQQGPSPAGAGSGWVSRANGGIDDVVAKPRELPEIKEPEPEPDFYPGSRRMGRYE